MVDICFVHADTYPVLSGTSGASYVGGEAVQHSLLAKAFAARGHRVSTIATDFGQADGEIVSDVRVLKTCAPSAGIPMLRYAHPRLSTLWRALKRANADIYYHSCAEHVLGILAWFCRLRDKQFVFRVAHDTDCVPGEEMIRFSRDRMLYRYGLRRADAIFAQTTKQRALLTAHHGLASTVVNMVVEEPAEPLDGPRDIDVLWVNNLRPFKRPDLLLEVAKSCPGLRFMMIGGPVPGLHDYYDRIMEAAREIPNLTTLGAVPYSEVNQYFARARLFVNTSDSEGFPNSFLQAWIRGVPVVSFFDPDNLIGRRELGAHVSGVGEMSTALTAFLGNECRRAALAASVRRYALDSHSPGSVVGRYEALFDVHS